MKICITKWVTTKTRSALSGSVPAIIHWPFSSGEEPISARDSHATSFSKNRVENEGVTLDDSQTSFSREKKINRNLQQSRQSRERLEKYEHTKTFTKGRKVFESWLFLNLGYNQDYWKFVSQKLFSFLKKRNEKHWNSQIFTENGVVSLCRPSPGQFSFPKWFDRFRGKT